MQGSVLRLHLIMQYILLERGYWKWDLQGSDPKAIEVNGFGSKIKLEHQSINLYLYSQFGNKKSVRRFTVI